MASTRTLFIWWAMSCTATLYLAIIASPPVDREGGWPLGEIGKIVFIAQSL
jgi:hypothetical protein